MTAARNVCRNDRDPELEREAEALRIFILVILNRNAELSSGVGEQDHLSRRHSFPERPVSLAPTVNILTIRKTLHDSHPGVYKALELIQRVRPRRMDRYGRYELRVAS